MIFKDISKIRLNNEQLIQSPLTDSGDLTSWFGAVQSQDFQNAKWALGLRINQNNEKIEKDFNDGKILRTHVMRPTWHFVTPKDIRWMLVLTAPRVKKVMSYYNRILELDEKVFEETQKILMNVLKSENFLTRTEIAAEFDKNGFSLKGQKLGHVVMQAELDGIICSGPRRGKQFTYALLSERAPDSITLSRDDALAELVKRFFQSHGPATIRDFVWWSGLTTIDAKQGIASNKLKNEKVEGKEYFFFDSNSQGGEITDECFLLPNYDEYTIAYQDREVFLNENNFDYFKNQGNATFWHAIVFRGGIVGAWRRTILRDTVTITPNVSKFQDKHFDQELRKAAKKYADFFNLKLDLRF